MSAMAELDLMLTEYEEAKRNVESCRVGSGKWFLAVEGLTRAADELVKVLRSRAVANGYQG